MKFGTDIHDGQRIIPNNFGDPLTSSSATMSLTFLVLSEMSQQMDCTQI